MFLKDYARAKPRSSAKSRAATKPRSNTRRQPPTVKMRYLVMLVLILVTIIWYHSAIINSVLKMHAWQKRIKQQLTAFWNPPESDTKLVTVEFYPPRE